MEKKEEDCAHGLQQQEWYWANASKEEVASAICVSPGLLTVQTVPGFFLLF